MRNYPGPDRTATSCCLIKRKGSRGVLTTRVLLNSPKLWEATSIANSTGYPSQLRTQSAAVATGLQPTAQRDQIVLRTHRPECGGLPVRLAISVRTGLDDDDVPAGCRWLSCQVRHKIGPSGQLRGHQRPVRAAAEVTPPQGIPVQGPPTTAYRGRSGALRLPATWRISRRVPPGSGYAICGSISLAGRCSAPRANVVIFGTGTAGDGIADQFRIISSGDNDHPARRCVPVAERALREYRSGHRD